jgi:outer membrane protein OmpA-like peptidoglycan-associated protein
MNSLFVRAARLFAFGMALSALGLPAVLPARAQTTAQTSVEVRNLLTTLAPRYEQNQPDVIVIKRPVEIEVEGRPVVVDYGYTFDFEVPFEFDSARLTGGARRILSALGSALESGELIGYEYLVAGHTDAKGSAC